MKNEWQETGNKGALTMPVGMEKRDMRKKRTEKALSTALFSLLCKRNFKEITVRDICEESLISRSTFYSQFTDKYNFLKWWIIIVYPDNIVMNGDVYKTKEQTINRYIANNKTIIKNLLQDADSWTLDVLFDVLHSVLHLKTDKTLEGSLNPKYVVMSNFYIGGMIQYILWQVRNGFPQEIDTMNIYLHNVIKMFQEWDEY